MNSHCTENNSPVSWLPAGLISWFAPGGQPVAMVTSWVALVGGESPRIRAAWHGQEDPSASSWAGGDFVMNVPYGADLARICEVAGSGGVCLDVERDLKYEVMPGVVVAAPRLIDCAVQIECVDGRLVEGGFESDLSGEIIRLHRDRIVFTPEEFADLSVLQPLTPTAFRHP